VARVNHLVRKPTLEKHLAAGTVKDVEVYEQPNGGYLVCVQLSATVKGEQRRWLTTARHCNTVREFASLDGLSSFLKSLGVKEIHVIYQQTKQKEPDDAATEPLPADE
jgi:hypothetical protein